LKRPLPVRAYSALLSLLPRTVRERDGVEMVATFEAMYLGASGRWRRVQCVAESLGRLPIVAVAEWWDLLIRGGGGVDGMRTTTAQAFRGLMRAPSFTWSAVLLLGLGVGAVTTVFTLVDHLFLRPLPYPSAERLIRVQNGSHSFPDLRDFRAMSSVEAWAASFTEDANLSGEGDPLRFNQARVTDGFFDFFGAQPVHGRLLLSEDFLSANTVVLSYGAWDRVWGRDPSVVGRQVRIDGVPVVVSGVLSRDFSPPEVMVDESVVDVWRPVDPSHPDLDERAWHVLAVAGRLTRGATLEDANREAAAIAERRAREFPRHYVWRDGSVRTLPVVHLQEATVGRAREGLSLLLGAVTLLLLVACANVAHLFMARGLGRSKELAVRRALGARTGTLSAQLLAESLLVAAGGSLIGVLLAVLGLEALLRLMPEALPRATGVAIDVRVLAFVVALSALTALVFGLLPSLRASGHNPGDALRAGGRSVAGGTRARALRSGLLGAEVALSLVLVSGAGLLLRSFARLNDVPLGFRVEDVWTVPLFLGGEERQEARIRRLEGIVDALRRAPGVRSAGYGLSIPLQHTTGNCCWSREVRSPDAPDGLEAMIHPLAGDYFEVFEPRLLVGALWSPTEGTVAPRPVLLNETLALALFGSVDGALGREVVPLGPEHRVSGVVADDRHYGVDRDHGPALYAPVESVPFTLDEVHVAVRTEPGAIDMPRALREAVWGAEPDLPVPVVRSMQEWVERATARTRFDSAMFTAFGVIALLLAAGGLYGTLLYVVGTERREVGIRIALGAERRRIEGHVLTRVLRVTAAGVALGLVGAHASGKLLESRLFGVQPGDPTTLLASVSLLLITAIAASWIPARRAASVDPIEILREE
jgi:predicted permease